MLTLVLVASLAPAAPARAISVTGSVEVQTGAETEPLVRFAEVEAGATIITHEESFAALRLASGSLLRLGPNTRIALSRMDPGEVAGERKTEVRLVIGKVWARVLHLFGAESSFDIATDNAVAGVRGTAFWASTDGTTDEFVLDAGAVSVQAGGKKVLLEGKSAFAMVTGSEITPPGVKTPQEIAALRSGIGGSSAVIIDRLAHIDTWKRPPTDRRGGGKPRERLRKTILGPDGLLDSPVRPAGAADRIRGNADIEVRLRLP